MGRINCGIIGNILFGVFLIVIGLCSVYFQGDAVLSYGCLGYGAALLIWAIIKMALNIGMKCSLCPKCGHKFSWKEHRAFKQSGPCPGCQTVLIRAKWPLRIINASIWILIVFLWVVIVTDFDQPLFNYLFLTLLPVDLILTEVGMVTLRFEIVDEPKESS